jgi:hypothetical protein
MVRDWSIRTDDWVRIVAMTSDRPSGFGYGRLNSARKVSVAPVSAPAPLDNGRHLATPEGGVGIVTFPSDEPMRMARDEASPNIELNLADDLHCRRSFSGRARGIRKIVSVQLCCSAAV